MGGQWGYKAGDRGDRGTGGGSKWVVQVEGEGDGTRVTLYIPVTAGVVSQLSASYISLLTAKATTANHTKSSVGEEE